MLRLALPAALLIATPVAAQKPQDAGPWTVEGNRAILAVAGIAIPDRLATLALTSTGEVSHPGEKLDNVAKFETPDGKVFATAYIYRPSYADAALASYATERAIRSRFGADVALETTVVPFGGEPRGAIRQVYRGGKVNGDALTTAAAFARVGPWQVKLRASGPANRSDEVLRALDALIAGFAVKGGHVYPAAPMTITAPCPAKPGKKARLVSRKDDAAAAMIGGLFGGSVVVGDEEKKEDADALLSFPRNGLDPACIRDTMVVGGQRFDLLFRAQDDAPETLLAVLSDAGTVLAVQPALMMEGYTIKQFAIGEVKVAGTLTAYPTAEQLSAWITDPKSKEMAIRSMTRATADGDTTTEFDGATLK